MGKKNVDESLNELLRLCRKGDEDAITRLVNRFQNSSLHYAESILKDKSLAEDAVQEAFITGLQKLPELRNPDRFPGWFRKIVRTQVYRILRKQHELPLKENRDYENEFVSQKKVRQRNEIQRKVQDAILSLSPSSRRTTELFYLDELSCTQISDILQVPKGTVKRRLHDARKKLRDILLGSLKE